MQRDLLLYGGSMREGLEFFLIYTHTGSEKRSASHFLCATFCGACFLTWFKMDMAVKEM